MTINRVTSRTLIHWRMNSEESKNQPDSILLKVHVDATVQVVHVAFDLAISAGVERLLVGHALLQALGRVVEDRADPAQAVGIPDRSGHGSLHHCSATRAGCRACTTVRPLRATTRVSPGPTIRSLTLSS